MTRQRVANYYVKPKEKKGPSGQAWALLAAVTTSIAGISIYALGKHPIAVRLPWLLIVVVLDF